MFQLSIFWYNKKRMDVQDMNFIENVEKEIYEDFVKKNKKGHFMQSYYWGDVSSFKHFTPHYVGLQKDGKLIATALLLQKHLISRYSYFYCPRGFVCNYEDLEVVKTFVHHIAKYCKKNHGIFFRMDPDIPLQKLDSEGNVLEELNYPLIDSLKKMGFKHSGFNKNFENDQPRYTFRLSISNGIEEVRRNMHPTTRKIINRGNIYHLDIYKGTKEDIKDFYATMIETAERENLVLSPMDYYETFYEVLHQQNMSDIYLVKVNIDDLKKSYEEKIKLINEEISLASIQVAKQNQDKRMIKLKELNQQLEKNNGELAELKNITEEKIILSAIITAKYQNKVWTIHGGNRSCLRYLNANYWLYYQIIEDACKEGYQVVDFFGTTGEPKADNTVYGIHLFKKRFGGEYTEFIGQFDLVLHPILYFGYTKIFPKVRKFIKK